MEAGASKNARPLQETSSFSTVAADTESNNASLRKSLDRANRFVAE
jgi:hypothetical protein